MVVAKSERVAGHFKKNPNDNRSDRAIADDLGVSKDTVRRARNSTGAREPVEDDDRPTIDKPPMGKLWDDQWINPMLRKLSRLINVNTINTAKNHFHSSPRGATNSRFRSVCSVSLVSFLVVISFRFQPAALAASS
jgi:hypothetical protein